MFTALAAILTVLAIVFHEMGHAIAMSKRGVEIAEMNIGLPPLRWRLPNRWSFPVYISPLLIFAYVRPSEKGLEQLGKLNYNDYAICLGSGVLANLIYATVLIDIAYGYSAIGYGLTLHDIVILVVLNGLMVVLGPGRRWALRYIFPVLSAVIMGLLTYSFFHYFSYHAVTTHVQDHVVKSLPPPPPVQGAQGIVQELLSHSLFDALTITAAVSLSFGFLNLLPLMPLDGGKVALRIIKSFSTSLSVAFGVISGLAFAFVIVFAYTH